MNTIKIGTVGQLEFRVTDADTIDVLGQSELSVLSTPRLIWHLEHAAIKGLEPVLEAGETSVGVQVDVRHLAATPTGFKVTCRARVIQVDGPSVTFQVEAHDDHEPIARGIHQRRIVPIDRLARRVRRKRGER